MLAKVMTKNGTHAPALLNTKKEVAMKATIMPTMEIKSVINPNTNFEGNDWKKSSSM
jgi:hypothetical protein